MVHPRVHAPKELVSTGWRDEDGGAHLVPVVVGDGEARGVLGLGLGPLADRCEHAPHEAALVPGEVEPGDRGGGGREEHRGEEKGAARHHRQRGEPTTSWLVGSRRRVCGAWLLCACVRARVRSFCFERCQCHSGAGGDWGKPREPGGGAGWRGGDSDV